MTFEDQHQTDAARLFYLAAKRAERAGKRRVFSLEAWLDLAGGIASRVRRVFAMQRAYERV
jgi:hypothetical protein